MFEFHGLISILELTSFLSVRNIDHTWRNLAIDMEQLVVRRCEELNESSTTSKKHGDDIFTRLVNAMDDDAKYGLTRSEVVSDNPTFSLCR